MKNKISNNTKSSNITSNDLIIGKVYYNNNDYEIDERLNQPGAILFSNFYNNRHNAKIDTKLCKLALPLNSNNILNPLHEELVLIFKLPNNKYEDNHNNFSYYYTSIINIWGNSHHNIVPSFNNSFTENSNVRNIKINGGDYIIQGRYGNSLKFGGIDNQPYTILTNNHQFPINNTEPYVEDINKDGSTIIQTNTTNHRLNTNYDININSDENIILLNSDNIHINSRLNNIILSSNNKTQLYAKHHIFKGDILEINNDYIHLGDNKKEFMLLGTSTVNLLDDLIISLSKFSSNLKNSIPTSAGGASIQDIVKASSMLLTSLKNIKSKTHSIKSKRITVS